MREMVEVVHIDTAKCRECSGVHHNSPGSAVQANNILRPERGLSGSSGIVIDQGLLLLILTVGLIMLVVLVCLGDIWIRSHPRHPVSMVRGGSPRLQMLHSFVMNVSATCQ